MLRGDHGGRPLQSCPYCGAGRKVNMAYKRLQAKETANDEKPNKRTVTKSRAVPRFPGARANRRGAAPEQIPPECRGRLWDRLQEHWGDACPIAFEAGLFKMQVELHHAHLHNTITNRMLYPLVIHSIVNLVPVSHEWHMQRQNWRPSKHFNAAAWQRFFERHPAIAAWANGRVD